MWLDEVVGKGGRGNRWCVSVTDSRDGGIGV